MDDTILYLTKDTAPIILLGAMLIILGIVIILFGGSYKLDDSTFLSTIDSRIKRRICKIVYFVSVFVLGIFIIVMSFMFQEAELGQIKSADNLLTSTYQVEIVKYPIQISENNPEKNKLIIKSLNSNDNSEYFVFLFKQDDDWKLCKRNDNGEYIALNPEHTIQDLKED